MEEKFFEQLKKYILKKHENSDDLKDHILSYEVMLQNKDGFKPILEDFKKWEYMEIDYEEFRLSPHIAYHYGSYFIRFDDSREKRPDYYYEILLLEDKRFWGYCQCTPDKEGYNSNKKCCGIGCDWVSTAFILRKIENGKRFEFNGLEKDLWDIEEKWSKELEKYNERIKQKKIQNIENRIAELQWEKEKLLNNTY